MEKNLDDDVEKDIKDCSKNVTEKCGVVNNNMSNNVEGKILEDHFDEDLSSLDRSSDKAERLAHHNNCLDDLDISLCSRLLHRDKCRVRPVKAAVNDSIIVSSSTSPGTILNLAKESCSTLLDYVGPLITDELDSEKRWSYKDPDGNVQGSFSLAQLCMWKDYFPSNLKIWSYYGNVKETILLHSAIKRRIKDAGFYLFSSSIMNSGRSKEDHVIGISKSVFITNFRDYFKSRDLWSLCEAYGKVVVMFIPNRKSKAGKRFAFVRFIRVDDMDRLISNLCTLWVGRLHLHANAVRYERSPKPSSSSWPPTVKVHAIPPPTRHFPSSFATVVNDNHSFPVLNMPGPPALVLDDCVHEEDMSRKRVTFLKKNRLLETITLWQILYKAIVSIGIRPDDPFEFYDLLKKPMNVHDNDLDPSLSHPLSFTSATSQQENFDPSPAQQKVNRDESLHEETPFLKSKSEENRHANESHTIDYSSEASTCVHSRTTLKGGSFLDVLDDMIKFGGREDGRVLIHMVHPSAKKMSKLDRFLVSEGIILGFPAITAVCLDRHFSDHRPILLNEIHTDFGPTPFRTYHSWFSREGLDAMVEHADSNSSLAGTKKTILKDLGDIDKALDNRCISDELLVKRMEL
nr:hypothetical protein CTI12_AA509060 [Tanacetum cinerariifolium]